MEIWLIQVQDYGQHDHSHPYQRNTGRRWALGRCNRFRQHCSWYTEHVFHCYHESKFHHNIHNWRCGWNQRSTGSTADRCWADHRKQRSGYLQCSMEQRNHKCGNKRCWQQFFHILWWCCKRICYVGSQGRDADRSCKLRTACRLWEPLRGSCDLWFHRR